MQCEEFRDDLLDVLYDEADTRARQRVEAHLADCATCREEQAAFATVRRDLQQWRLPEAGSRPGPLAGAGGRAVWRLAAAAVLLLACGGALGLSGFQFRYARGPVELSLGRSAEAAELRRLLAEQQARHEAELAAIRAALPPARSAAPGGAEAAILARVDEMIHESEERQLGRVETAWGDFLERAEAQRRYDLARVSAGLSYLDQKTGEQAARTTELMSYLLQASDRR